MWHAYVCVYPQLHVIISLKHFILTEHFHTGLLFCYFYIRLHFTNRKDAHSISVCHIFLAFWRFIVARGHYSRTASQLEWKKSSGEMKNPCPVTQKSNAFAIYAIPFLSYLTNIISALCTKKQHSAPCCFPGGSRKQRPFKQIWFHNWLSIPRWHTAGVQVNLTHCPLTHHVPSVTLERDYIYFLVRERF